MRQRHTLTRAGRSRRGEGRSHTLRSNVNPIRAAERTKGYMAETTMVAMSAKATPVTVRLTAFVRGASISPTSKPIGAAAAANDVITLPRSAHGAALARAFVSPSDDTAAFTRTARGGGDACQLPTAQQRQPSVSRRINPRPDLPYATTDRGNPTEGPFVQTVYPRGSPPEHLPLTPLASSRGHV